MMKTYYESFGCQMNVFDTEVIESMMIASGFETVQSAGEADVIILNTCSVRENAEQRAIGRLNDLSRNKAVLVACGCMAQRMGNSLFDKVSGLSLVIGPDNYLELVSAVISIIESGETCYYRAGCQGSLSSRIIGFGKEQESFSISLDYPWMRELLFLLHRSLSQRPCEEQGYSSDPS